MNRFEYPFLHSITQFFQVKHEQICRFFYWGWKMRNNYDFDYSGLYEMIELKLHRMYENNKNFSNLTKSDTRYFLKRIKTCELLMKRLKADNYVDWEKYYDKETNTFIARQFLKLMRQEDKLVEQDLELFCKIFKKYSRTWWN